MKTISRKILLEKDYTEWKKDNYQKVIIDEIGKKYFINIVSVDLSLIQKNLGIHWTPQMQLETDKGSVNFELVQWFNNNGEYSGRTIEEVEEYFENLFVFHNKPYYERF